MRYTKDKKGRTIKEITAIDFDVPCPICGSKYHTVCNKKMKL